MDDAFYMDFAVKFASIAEGQTSPNPLVGAVIVKEGEIIGFGSHLKAGHSHAEVNALQMAGSRAKGSTVYVTLEPCAHHGKTPPCATALADAGVSRVVIAAMDPNPLVSGKGIAYLKNAGIEVEIGILKEKADALNEVFYHFIQEKEPFVTMKQAISLDGKIAVSTQYGEPVTGEQVLRDVHSDRGRHDAILVGIGTVLIDNPILTNRFGVTEKQPIRIVLDTHLKMPPTARVVNDSCSPTWIFTGMDVTDEEVARFKQSHVEIIRMTQPTINPIDVLRFVGERQVMSLYVEGGKSINASFLKSRRVNRLITYIAPKIVGGDSAIAMFGELDVQRMEDAYKLKFQQVDLIGEDLKVTSILK